MEQVQSAKQVLRQMVGGSWVAQAIHVAAELGIADALADRPRTARELAQRVGADGDALYRLLRALASVDIFEEDAEGRFSLTPLGEPLRADIPDSQRAFAIMMGAEFYQSWGHLLHSVRTGREAWSEALGKPCFQYLTEHPDRGAIYDAAMNGVHGSETEPMLDAYDFSPFETVVDLGGGNGLMLAEILERYPAAEGILFELPSVTDRARAVLSARGLSDRCRIVGGDFFQSIPRADAYLLRHVLHDWQDEQATAILRHCRNAMNPQGRILAIETVIPPLNEPCFGKWLDLMMLLVNGRERTEDQYRRLFSRAGLRIDRIVPTAHEISIIEGVRS
jgi:hypothetical protein